jgi:hypothetical protein
LNGASLQGGESFETPAAQAASPPPQVVVMKNITLSVSDAVYRDARVWAAQHGTSISATVQRLLEHLPTLERAPRAAGKADRTPAVAPLADTVSPSRPPTPPQAVIL